ncbi:MAG: RagB/SusD family nutrient uptake outer membrane protein, partial [Butyricimonas faecihominis]
MMKKSISYIMLFFCLSFMSCNKWLDVPSKEEVIDYEMFKTEQGFMDAMAGVYFLMGDNGLYGDMLTMTFLDVLAHRYYVNVYDVDKLGVNLGQANYYQQDRVTPVVNSIWQKGYNVIANVNSILEQIEDYKSVFSDDNYRLIKGEALGVRAFMHFDLLRMFGNSYRTGADSLAIPYVTTLSGRVWPLFDTGNGVINLALRDLQVADSLLSIDDIHASSIENQWIN